MFAVPVVRGCGTRKEGGVYWELGFSEYGSPLESFIIDSPIPVNPDDLGLSAQGVKMIEQNGIWHVLDWVGAGFYPNVTDFLEEVRRFGLSRRCELNADQYSKLSSESRLLLMHTAAIVAQQDLGFFWPRIGMQDELIKPPYSWNLCPKQLPEHELSELVMCAGLWWEDCVDIETVGNSRQGVRHMPSFEYACALPPAIVTHDPGFFASFPLGRLVVVRDPISNEHEDKLKKLAEVTEFPVQVVEE